MFETFTQNEHTKNFLDSVFERLNKKQLPGVAVTVGSLHKEQKTDGFYGYADLHSNLSIAQSSKIFGFASVSKQFTGYLFIQAFIEGYITSIQDSIQKYLPDCPWDIPIERIISHTSGLRDYTDFYMPCSLTDAFAFIIDNEFLHATEEMGRFNYSNTNYILLAELVSTVYDQSFNRLLHELVEKKFNLPDFHTYSNSYDSALDQVCVPALTKAPRSYKNPFDKRRYATLSLDPTRFVLGDGGIYGTVDTLARWALSLLNNNVLLEYAKTKLYVASVAGMDYGYGWYIDSERCLIDHYGEWGGYQAYLGIYYKTEEFVALLSNTVDTSISPYVERIHKYLETN